LLLLLWHVDVYVHLCSPTAEPPSPPGNYPQHDHDDKNHEHGNHTGAAASASIVVGHINPLIGELV
jgi:hypothetical protein